MSKFLKVSYDRKFDDGSKKHISAIFPIDSVVIRLNERNISFYCAFSDETINYYFDDEAECFKYYKFISRHLSMCKTEHQLIDVSMDIIESRINLAS